MSGGDILHGLLLGFTVSVMAKSLRLDLTQWRWWAFILSMNLFYALTRL